MPRSKKEPEAAHVNRIQGIAGVGCLRLGLYDPCQADEVVDWIDEVYDDDEDGRKAVRRVIGNFNQWAASQPGVTLCMGVYSLEARSHDGSGITG